MSCGPERHRTATPPTLAAYWHRCLCRARPMLRAKGPVATSVRGITGRLVDLPAVAQRLKTLRTGLAGMAVSAGEAAIRAAAGCGHHARMPRVSGDPAASSLL